jgi:hypothetical protein
MGSRSSLPGSVVPTARHARAFDVSLRRHVSLRIASRHLRDEGQRLAQIDECALRSGDCRTLSERCDHRGGQATVQ